MTDGRPCRRASRRRALTASSAHTLHPLPTPPPPAQASEPNYRWDDKHRLSKDEMSKGSGAAVKHGLLQYAYDHAIDRFARLGTEVLTVRQLPSGR